MTRTGFLLASLALAAPALAQTNKPSAVVRSVQPAPGVLDASLRNEAAAAVDRGLNWLTSKQKEDGSWSDSQFPALTALPLWPLVRRNRPDDRPAIERAVAFIVSCAREDGGLYREVEGRKGGGLSNYNTAICMTVLHATGNPALSRYVLAARRFVAGGQHFGGDIYDGGFGYDAETQRPYTDLLNTYYSVQGMRLTADAEEARPPGEKRADIDWGTAAKYIEQMQSKPDSGGANAGGFVYNPTDPKAGTLTNETGKVYLRSYGSITYAGLLALIYANVSRDDPRVRSALDWASRHWSLDENPGMGQDGLYFFYHVLTRALGACGQDLVPRPDGTFVDWRTEAAKKVVSLQKIDPDTGHGYWLNPTGRYWESDPVLVTAYCLLALQSVD